MRKPAWRRFNFRPKLKIEKNQEIETWKIENIEKLKNWKIEKLKNWKKWENWKIEKLKNRKQDRAPGETIFPVLWRFSIRFSPSRAAVAPARLGPPCRGNRLGELGALRSKSMAWLCPLPPPLESIFLNILFFSFFFLFFSPCEKTGCQELLFISFFLFFPFFSFP